MLSKYIFCAFILFPLICFPQTETAEDSTSNDYNHEIQFYFINQVIIAYKYNISENSGLRFRANVTGLFNNNESENIEYNDPETNTPHYYRKYKNTQSDHFFEINIHYLYMIRTNSIMHLYFGGGPFLNYNNRIREEIYENYTNENILDYTYLRKYKEEIWNAGISAIVGIESIVYKNFTFFAEYEAAFSKGWYTRSNYAPRPSYYSATEKYHEWNYELKGIRIGAGIYF